MLSLATFYKHLSNPIERTFNTDAANVELTYRNVQRAQTLGLELNIKQNLKVLSPVLSPFQLGANAAWIYSWVRIDAQELAVIRVYQPSASATRSMFGQSPYVVNAFLGYSYQDWTANVSYNIFGKRISIVTRGGPNIFEQPRHALNANVSRQWGSWKMRLSIRNILNTRYTFSQEHQGENYIYQSYRLGQTFSVGFSYLLE